MFENYKLYWTEFFNFQGRSTRSQFWGTFLINFFIAFILVIIEIETGTFERDGGLITSIWYWLNIIPNLAIISRRLHDAGKSALWLFAIFVPFLNLLVLYYLLSPSVSSNVWGPGNDYTT